MTKSGRLRAEIRQSKPFSSPAEEATLGLMRTTDRLGRHIASVVEPFGITPQQYNVLRILRGSHPERLPTLEIATRMIEQAPGITRLLDRLEAKGLVKRERCDEDRRRVYCAITARGLSTLARLETPIARAARDSFRSLSTGRIRQLISLLDDLREGLNREGNATKGDSE